MSLMLSTQFQHTAIIRDKLLYNPHDTEQSRRTLQQCSLDSPWPGDTMGTFEGSGEGQVTPLSVMVAGDGVSWKKQEYDSPSSSLGRPGMDKKI